MKLRWKDKWIDFVSVDWSGTDNQCSRQVAFSVPNNPYDKTFEQLGIALGDLIYLYDKKRFFIGTVTNRERSAETGSATYTAKDFMHYLLNSSGTFKFKNTTPEKMTRKVCSDLKIKTGSLAVTNFKISKLIFDDQKMYDIIVSGYRRARAKTGKNYMPTMDGSKVCVIEKGKASGVKLTQGVHITGATYSDTTDNMVNTVNIYSSKMKKLGQVRNKKNVSRYGIYQAGYTKESGVDAKAEAKSMLVGVTSEITVEAPGNLKAISGRSIKIDDKATGLKGTFYITADRHNFSNGVHTMTLTLSRVNEMEEGAEAEDDSGKKELENKATCYYLPTSNVYHSSNSCSACAGKNTKKSTVQEIKFVLKAERTKENVRIVHVQNAGLLKGGSAMNAYEKFIKIIREEAARSKKNYLIKLAEMTGKDSCRTGTLELDKDDLIVNETLKGKLQAGDVVLITQISEETFAILAKAGEL